jgi:diguanylate cyclase (GGDEF)-like protein
VKKAYTEKHHTFLEALGPYIAIAIENSLIHDRMEELNRVILGEKAELEQAAMRISHLANHDSLTGLPNRRLLFELLQKSFDIASRTGTKVGVLYVDLDNFKPINDKLGHAAGDRALVAISERFKSMLRASDTVARLGGDEFILVVTNIHDRPSLALIARKIIEECGHPLFIDGHECHIGLSMGIAVYPDDGDRIEDLVTRSDAAMYAVKREAKNGFAFFEAEQGSGEA